MHLKNGGEETSNSQTIKSMAYLIPQLNQSNAPPMHYLKESFPKTASFTSAAVGSQERG
jgi:hypothetical protein